jgi:hypothetical protein
MSQALYIPTPGVGALSLPANAAVIRCICGDSLSGGTTAPANTPLSDLKETHTRGGAPTTTVLYREDAYFWNKWFRLNGSSQWSTEFRYTETAEAANAWELLHDRAGFNNGGPFAALASAPSISLPWMVHYFANQMPRYRDAATGERLPIHYVHFGISSSFVGAYATNTNASWSPTHNDGGFEMWQATFLAPAVNALRAAGKQVYIESMFFTGGGADSNNGAGTPGATNLGQNLEALLAAMGKRSGGRIPTVLIRPTFTGSASFPDYAAAQTSFDTQFDAFGDGFTDYIRMEGIPKTEATWPGIHPTSDGLVMMAQRYSEALGRLVSRGARLVAVKENLA